LDTYLKLVKKVLGEGKEKNNRTGISALTIPGAILQHNCQTGFPLITTKKIYFKAICVELEAFIKGINNKKWFQERDCHIWDKWCNPKKIPANFNNVDRKKFQLEEEDLGKIYGCQWRNFNGVDQLLQIVTTLKNNPTDRRMLVTAWNPKELDEMAIPPCHVLFHLIVLEKTLHLTWFQRSCDLMLGIPFNIAFYSILLHLLSYESGFEVGSITGLLSDVHIYKNHIQIAQEQIARKPYPLPTIKIIDFINIFEWEHTKIKLNNYLYHPRLLYPVAV
jgi:thymidylate synthase